MEAAITNPGTMADQDVCIAVGEDLTLAYPGYVWLVGADHAAGTIAIDIAVPKPIGLEKYGWLLHIGLVLGPGGQKLVRHAGGDLLERFGLRRTFAHSDTHNIAKEHGLDIDGAVTKSRGSTV